MFKGVPKKENVAHDMAQMIIKNALSGNLTKKSR